MKIIKLLAVSILLVKLLLSSFVPNVSAQNCEPWCTFPHQTCIPKDDCEGCSHCGKPTSMAPIVNPVLSQELSSLSGEAFLGKFLNVAITLLLIIGSVYFFFTLTLGGIAWMSSSGDKAKAEGAHKQITNAFIGLVILFSGFAIIKLIEYLFGINILKITLPTI